VTRIRTGLLQIAGDPPHHRTSDERLFRVRSRTRACAVIPRSADALLV